MGFSMLRFPELEFNKIVSEMKSLLKIIFYEHGMMGRMSEYLLNSLSVCRL